MQESTLGLERLDTQNVAKIVYHWAICGCVLFCGSVQIEKAFTIKFEMVLIHVSIVRLNLER